MRLADSNIALAVLLSFVPLSDLVAVDKQFHDAPDSAKAMKNPYEGQQAAADTGKTLYARNCLACHGKTGQGIGSAPSLVDGALKSVPSGEVFWFISQGDTDNGMPSWAFLPEEKRWQIVTYVKSLAAGKGAERQVGKN
jgi:mono/diheme cytochrome c family protein